MPPQALSEVICYLSAEHRVRSIEEGLTIGERAGYRAREGNNVSDILRRPWYHGGGSMDIYDLGIETAKNLLGEGRACKGWPTPYGRPVTKKAIGGRGSAFRHDLDLGRLTAAMFSALYKSPLDSIEQDTNCNISDHGLFELELVKWNHWNVNHYEISWEDNDGHPTRVSGHVIAKFHFQLGHLLSDADSVKFEWHGIYTEGY